MERPATRSAEAKDARDRREALVILVDVPMWPAHGRLWAHLVSDTSLDELHEFAARMGVPARGFDRDHYDVPADRIDALVAAGAVPVDAHELTRRLIASGLRVRGRDRH
jgi:hypothetical protein